MAWLHQIDTNSELSRKEFTGNSGERRCTELTPSPWGSISRSVVSLPRSSEPHGGKESCENVAFWTASQPIESEAKSLNLCF